MRQLNLRRALDNKNWYVGKVLINGVEYKINILRFDQPSDFGIDGGRISKMYIFTSKEALVWYDREWETEPSPDNKDVQEVYKLLLSLYN